MTDKALAARLRGMKLPPGYNQQALNEAADLIEQMAQREPVATVYYPRTGGNVGLSWKAIPETGHMPPDGARLYLAPPARKPLSEEQVFADDGIMAANARIGLLFLEIMEIARAVEQAHGIKEQSDE